MIDFTRETPDEVKERLLGEMTELKKVGEDLLALASANSPRHAEINNLLSFFEVNKEFILSVDFANLTDDDKKELTDIDEDLIKIRTEFAQMAQDPTYAGRSGHIANE